MTIDLRDAIDASFGEGPPLPPAGDRLAAGQAAVRRRRLGTVAGSATAVAAVVVASFALTGQGGRDPQGTEPLAPSSTSAAESSTSEAELQAELDRLAEQARAEAARVERARKADLVNKQFPASLDPNDGSLVVKRGWEVVQRVEEPVGFAPPEKSLGVVVTDGTTTRWMLLCLNQVYDHANNPIVGEVSPSASADDANKGYSRFEDWLASMAAISGGPQNDPLVVVSADDEVTAGPAATLVDLQEIPVVDGYTSPGDRVAEVERDGRTWWVVLRGHGAQAEVIPVDGDVLPESTLDALLAYLAQQTQNGEGVR